MRDLDVKGLLFDIQSFSVHDGPGCRTTVFMNGCPLKCEWCANPESWKGRPQIMFAKTKCKYDKGCSLCINACPHNAISLSDDGVLLLNWKLCDKCTTFDCAKVCSYEALKVCGKWYTVEELIKILNRDSHSWSKEGGVTFSGGEVFYQKDFLMAALRECKKNYIHTVIETSAFVDTDTFMKVMQYIDFAFIDIKHMDREKHKQKTGVYNDLILKNIETLAKSDWSGRIVLRMPVIKEFNDSDENIIKITEFMKKVGLFEINILPFHRMGDSKWSQLGRKYPYSKEKPTSQKKLDHIQEIFLDSQIACYTGSETPF
ncbi:4-hydroxyphenylacetate decarboxylase activase [Clostridium aestuarii]|uniref:4-hydroxyphenylacetate decarboxylase activase n=1 Tax=Clostridium aestuarii TaxID=338193 RepID=A0ABT4D1P7_9CLOT|nr:4-hydroxyphenylacetate decarboxylase activase [Clostridium aestuarii]MCY6484075.1 4-hydroxyphenylacetate decarboxylase activase [Clostridium aestuarii]